MNKNLWLGIACAASLLTSACSSPDVAATSARSCAAPEIEISAPKVRADETVSISGQWFFDGCADAIVIDQNGTEHKDEVHPLSNIHVTLEQNGTSFNLGATSASEDGSWTAEFPLPSQATTGEITISAGSAEPVTATITPVE